MAPKSALAPPTSVHDRILMHQEPLPHDHSKRSIAWCNDCAHHRSGATGTPPTADVHECSRRSAIAESITPTWLTCALCETCPGRRPVLAFTQLATFHAERSDDALLLLNDWASSFCFRN
jgi:hypothetical protein